MFTGVSFNPSSTNKSDNVLPFGKLLASPLSVKSMVTTILRFLKHAPRGSQSPENKARGRRQYEQYGKAAATQLSGLCELRN